MRRSILHLAVLLGLILSAFVVSQAGAQAGTPPKPAPDVLVFTNGDQLTGKLISAAGGSAVFNSDMAGSVTVSLDKVKELRSGTVFVALKKAPTAKTNQMPPEVTGTVLVEAKNVTVTPKDGTPQTMPTADLNYLVDPADYQKALGPHNFFRGWNGTASFGATLVRSTDSSTSVTASAALSRQEASVPWLPKRNRTLLNVSETYGTATSPAIPPTVPFTPPAVTLTSIFHADGERDEYFNARLYALGNLSFDHNYASGLQLQQLYGGGIGWTAFQNPKHELDLKGEVQFEQQEFISTPGAAPQPTLEIVGSTFQENYRRTLAKKIVMTEMANILPAWNNLQAYSANASLNFTLPVWKRLAATIGATDNYINNPAQYYRTNTFQFVTSVTYVIH